MNAVALGDKRGMVTMQGTGSASHVSRFDAQAPGSSCDGTIPVTTINQYVEDAGLTKIDFVKLDVEGFEPAVLQGGRAAIDRYRPPILMEFNSWCLSFLQDVNVREFATSLWAAFEVLTFDDDAGEMPAGDGSMMRFLHDNVVLHGAVDDVLLRRRATTGWPGFNQPVASTTIALRAEVEQLREQLAAVHKSHSWQATSPLRTLRRTVDRLISR